MSRYGFLEQIFEEGRIHQLTDKGSAFPFLMIRGRVLDDSIEAIYAVEQLVARDVGIRSMTENFLQFGKGFFGYHFTPLLSQELFLLFLSE